MSIAPIGFTPGLTGLTGLPSLPGLSGPSPAGDGFGQLVTENLDKLQGLHDASDGMAVKAATGDLQDIHDYMIAASESSVATELTVAVRNKAVEAFTEIMRMQV
jgi:flagellar hook-basal body complex protein FliE